MPKHRMPMRNSFFQIYCELRDLHSFPTRRSSDLAISLTQTAAEAANSLNCTLTVPANPLSAAGLATAWQLGDGCTMTNASRSEEHTSELQSHVNLVCRLLLEKKKNLAKEILTNVE